MEWGRWPVLLACCFITLPRMRLLPAPHRVPDHLVSYFWSGDAIRSRTVGDVVLYGTADLPALPARLVADWDREVAQRLCLEPGDVESLPLARARMRWPDYRHCVQAAADWMRTLGLPGLLDSAALALMACRGARYHHDADQYGGKAFCNLFLSEDKGLDVHFPVTGQRIPLTRGTALVFDTGQPHAVIRRGSNGFSAADFGPEMDATQVFLTWELPVEHAGVACALRVRFDTELSIASQLEQEQLWCRGARARLCPESGRWGPPD